MTPVVVKNSHKRGRTKQSVADETNVDSSPDHVTVATIKSKGGRPKGRTETKPRKPRSDKGRKRGPHNK